jgi:hypothetical protein
LYQYHTPRVRYQYSESYVHRVLEYRGVILLDLLDNSLK